MCCVIIIMLFCDFQVILRLLGTHLGRSAIYTMCTLLQERYAPIDYYLIFWLHPLPLPFTEARMLCC